jgi:hypothetical protein
MQEITNKVPVNFPPVLQYKMTTICAEDFQKDDDKRF